MGWSLRVPRGRHGLAHISGRYDVGQYDVDPIFSYRVDGELTFCEDPERVVARRYAPALVSYLAP